MKEQLQKLRIILYTFNSIRDQRNAFVKKIEVLLHFQFYPRSTLSKNDLCISNSLRLSILSEINEGEGLEGKGAKRATFNSIRDQPSKSEEMGLPKK